MKKASNFMQNSNSKQILNKVASELNQEFTFTGVQRMHVNARHDGNLMFLRNTFSLEIVTKV